MLIIPAMHIRAGRCVRTAIGESGTEGKYPSDPVSVARMWRGENAKALHVVSTDSAVCPLTEQTDMLRAVVEAVDIPLQYAAAFTDIDQVRLVLEDIGVYRVVVTGSNAGDFDFISTLIGRYGPRKIIVEIETDGEHVVFPAAYVGEDEHAKLPLHELRRLGVQRIVISTRNISLQPPVDFLLSVVEETNLSITLNGFIRHYRDLRTVQNIHPQKIDSIILDDVLYFNAFPCQKIWRLAEQQLMAERRFL